MIPHSEFAPAPPAQPTTSSTSEAPASLIAPAIDERLARTGFGGERRHAWRTLARPLTVADRTAERASAAAPPWPAGCSMAGSCEPQEHVGAFAATGRTPVSPRTQSEGQRGVPGSSVIARTRVDSCDRETSDYRVVLQGDLELEPSERETTP
jgi:hypothetical protein